MWIEPFEVKRTPEEILDKGPTFNRKREAGCGSTLNLERVQPESQKLPKFEKNSFRNEVKMYFLQHRVFAQSESMHNFEMKFKKS